MELHEQTVESKLAWDQMKGTIVKPGVAGNCRHIISADFASIPPPAQLCKYLKRQMQAGRRINLKVRLVSSNHRRKTILTHSWEVRISCYENPSAAVRISVPPLCRPNCQVTRP
jgi:hypothetical protein